MSRAAKIGTLVLAFVAAGALVAGVALSGAAAPGSGDALDRGQAALVGSNAIGGDAVGVDVAAQTTDGQVRGSPVLDLFLSQRTVSSGTESQVMVDILNTGEMDMGNDLDDRVTTARGLTLEVDDGDVPIEVGDGTTVVGDVRTDASPVQVPLDVTVPDDVPDGQYEVEVTARYRYTYEVIPEFNNHKDYRGIDRFDVTIVVVDDGARFAILDTETDAQVGGER